ncbi:hypothetical protein N7468_009936 [Penicillium chermesinum]|uniref:DNA repair protein Rad26 n=1 Tax=Penicillium chermesinum TaxID=63820 RepID=A0A9W9NBS4_9EURO|nr:uncharacterized protein N7468_009936 [Penicillium chermesinum]KAJ5216928.1 hypothetical protein N7468_009936 [Penicillium chermesinum]
MDNDDDYFSDEFDSLPPGTLYELEQNAFQATQAPATQLPPPNAGYTPQAQVKPNPRSTTLQPPPRLHTGLTNDYDTLEVGELEAEVHENVDGNMAHAPMGLSEDQPILIAENGWPVEDRMAVEMEVDRPQYAQEHNHEWDAHLKQLEQERERLRQELDEAKLQLETKAGEISIIRSKQLRMIAEHDRQLSDLRQALADEAAKHKEEVEAAMSEGKMLATENVFLQHDLAEESHQLRKFKTRHRNDEKQPPVTPKKNKALPFRDGFDDDEIAVVSPSKSAVRSKRATPTVPGKRKRQASQDSPAPLQLNSAADAMMIDSPVDASASTLEEVGKPQPESGEHEKRLIKRLLNHRRIPGQETDIEALSRMSFPSDPARPLSNIVLDELANLNMGSYLVEYIHTIGPLWQRALTERYYEPVPLFMAVVRDILLLDDAPIPELIGPLLGVLQDSVEVNAVPRFRYSPAAREKARVIRQTPQADLQPKVDSTEALRLLYQVACKILHVKRALESFWLHIRHTFILVMVHGSQSLHDIILILHLLSTSIRPESFGPIMASESEQADVQRWIIDRLTHMLSESAQPDEGLDPYTPDDICAMRLEVLLLLESLAFNPAAPTREHGSAIIAAHPNALARLFRSMHDELDALYTSPPEQDLRVVLVNGLMRLIFGVMRRHGASINMQEKLACVPGSKQKHLVVLTRLAFCDGCVLEAGIDDDTVDMAHELLEEWTNPQEAESLAEAFPSSRRD